MELKRQVEDRLRKVFPDSEISFENPQSDGKHFLLTIISEKFEGKSRIERSRLVYAQLDDLIASNTIHALRLQLKTPE